MSSSRNRQLTHGCTRRKRLEIPKTMENVNSSKVFIAPNNMIISGINLKPALNNIDEGNFQNVIKTKFSNRNKFLNNIQKYIWPQISDNKHFVILSEENDLTSSYLLPIINDIFKSRNYRRKVDFMGSIAVIFAPDSSCVDEIARQCEIYLKDLRIIKAVGMCPEKKIDLMNGCEILITTPSAYIRIIQGISLNIMDENRLKWLVFHDFNQKTLIQFDKEIEIIMRTRFSKNINKIPQTFFVSKHASKNLRSKILSFLDKKNAVFLMDNFLDASAFVGLSISIEVSETNEEKLDLLAKSANENFDKCVIAVNDDVNIESDLSVKGVASVYCDEPKIAKIWDESNSNGCILIINDDVINKSSIKNVNHLVHFDIPSNISSTSGSNQFSERFKIFHNQILSKLESSNETKENLKTKIILSNENLNEFEKLIKFLVDRDLLKAEDEIAKKIFEMEEVIKAANKAPFCSNLIQRGKCVTFNCPNRHNLSEQEKPPKYLDALKNFITFELVSLQGPTTFVIKIREYYDNKWISYDQSSEYVKQKLEIDMQKYCLEKKDLLTLNEGKVGHIYAKYDNNLGKWVRGKLIKRVSSEIVLLSLMDHATLSLEIPAVEKKLIELPQEFTQLNPLIYKLQIIGLVPFDGENIYSSNDVDKLQEFMKSTSKNDLFISEIETKIGDVLFARNMESKKRNKFDLKKVLLKLSVCQVDEKFCDNILKNVKVDSTKKEKHPRVVTQESIKPAEEVVKMSKKAAHWKQLKYDQSYSIVVTDYTSPYSFFVVLKNTENLTLKNVLQKIDEFDNLKPLIDFNSNDLCLFVSNDRKYRAIILSCGEKQSIKVLLVDHGEIQMCDKNNLYNIPDEFLNLKFQTIHCSMLGIRPRYNMKMWPTLQRSLIKGIINEYNQKSLKMLVIRNDQKKHEFNKSGINSYDVLLYDDESKLYLHRLAVEKRYADESNEFDEDYYESDSGEYETLIETSCSSDEDLTKSMHNNFKIIDEGNVMNSKDINDEHRAERMISYSTQISTSASITDSETSNFTCNLLPYTLKSMFKLPYIEWRQNDFMIYLLISAKDCHEYSLKINGGSLDIIVKYSDEKMERTIIQLYSSIRTKYCSHELAGMNIIVRLPKKKICYDWKRLTIFEEKSQFIKFSNEDVPQWKMHSNRKILYPKYQNDAPYSDTEDDFIDDKNLSDDEFLEKYEYT